MKIALATTTIHVPHALKLLRKCASDVKFFVALDEKSVPIPVEDDHELPTGCLWMPPAPQKNWKCSESLGWNTIARRNIAFLEALKWGADAIVSWDTDNYPLDTNYFGYFEGALAVPFDGIEVSGADGWLDAGEYLRPPAKHRGFPIQHKHRPVYHPATNRKVGIAAGLILNDPDIDAVTRIATAPDSQQVSLLAEAGMVIDLKTWTVFNTQNTAVIRELIPAWFLMPNVGRHDDIYASLIVQRVARERGYHVHFGKPFVVQQRHPHDLIRDLRAEIDGMEHVASLADLLDHIPLPGKSVIEDVRIIYQQLCHCDFIPTKSAEAGLLWLEDVERIL